MIKTNETIGYTSGMPLLVFNIEEGVYYWELVVGGYFNDKGQQQIITQRYYRGLPLLYNGYAVTPTYLQSSLDYLTAKEEWVYFAQKNEVPPIVYYLN